MRLSQGDSPRLHHLPPPIGWRIIKTTVAVFLCLVIYWLRVFHGQDMPSEAAITAIICMQPYVKDSGEYALNRLVGTLIGAFLGLLLLLVLYIWPAPGGNLPVLYALMAVGVLLSLYLAVLMKMPDASGLAAIVFLCVVIAFPDIEDPLRQAAGRIFDVFIGTTVAILVNIFHLPRRRRRDLLLFVHTEDLAPDPFTQLAPAVLFHLNALYNDGARICLVSQHAPAFFAMQLRGARLSTPLIVMDGAAIYDAEKNVYLQAETIPPENSLALRDRLDELGISYFVYTIHHNRACIFHTGDFREEEKEIYDRLRQSPYRSYFEGEIYDPGEIVYFKVIGRDSEMGELEKHLSRTMPKAKLRRVCRPQPGTEGISGLYIYAHTATQEQAEKRVVDYLRQGEPELKSREIRSPTGYRTERDAMSLMRRVADAYEPLLLFGGREQ